MPIDGKLYTAQELQEILNVSKQRISNLASDRDWDGPQPGIYWAEFVEPYLQIRGIDPIKLSVRTYTHPEGITWADLEKEFDNLSSCMVSEIPPSNSNRSD